MIKNIIKIFLIEYNLTVLFRDDHFKKKIRNECIIIMPQESTMDSCKLPINNEILVFLRIDSFQ